MPGGRPSKYDEINLEQVKILARYGHTEEQIAEIIGVSIRTLDAYKKDKPEFLRALKEGKETPDRKVEESLYKRATGYTGPDGKHYPPDSTAMIYWLKNRKPKEWRDKREVEHGNMDGKALQVVMLPELNKEVE